MTIIKVRAPVRVDFAGGSLDLWPVGLMVPGAVTVNCAVSLAAKVECSPFDDEGIRLVSEDLGVDYLWKRGSGPGDLPLMEKLCCTFGETRGYTLRTSSDAPPGSGLGGSSAMALATALALLGTSGTALPDERIVAVCRDVEAQLLGIPTGVQDYWPALMGGLLSIKYEPGGERVEKLDVPLKEVAARMIVAYSGRSRLSSGTNWALVKRFLDGDRKTVEGLVGIADTAREIVSALVSGDMDLVGRLIGEEWSFRRNLAPGISTPRVEALLDCGRRAGALGGKACGAGGGGCVLLWTEPSTRQDVEKALEREGALLLPAHPVEKGAIIEK